MIKHNQAHSNLTKVLAALIRNTHTHGLFFDFLPQTAASPVWEIKRVIAIVLEETNVHGWLKAVCLQYMTNAQASLKLNHTKRLSDVPSVSGRAEWRLRRDG